MQNDMNSVDIDREEAIDKLRELVKHNSMCLFTTNLTELPLHAWPMSVSEVSVDGSIWFLSPDDSNKNRNIEEDRRVQLFFTNSSDSEFLTVYGTATISRDKSRIDDLWSPFAKAWFTKGKDDPRITVIEVRPEDAYYWDTKSGKMISLIKIMASAVTGKTNDDGVQGNLSVR